MTMNDSWGYQTADDDWKTPKTVVRNLITCARDGGNYLLNIGPKAGRLHSRGIGAASSARWASGWTATGQSIYESETCQPRRSNYASFTRKGNTLYMHVHFWPGSTVAMGGLMTKVKSARLLATGKEVKFEQDKFRVRFVNLPEKAPDDPVSRPSLSNATASRARTPISCAKSARASRLSGHFLPIALRLAAQPSFTLCRARPSASASAGTGSVITEPAATYEPSAISIGRAPASNCFQ